MGDIARISNQARAALVAAVLLTFASLAFLVWPAVETLYSGTPAEMPVFDAVIWAASVPAPGKIVIAFAHVVVVLVTFVIGEKIDSRLWNFIAYSSLLSLIAAIYLYVHTTANAFESRFDSFPFVGSELGPIWATGTAQQYEQREAEIAGALRSWIYFGGFWNLFVFISMLKNKVATDLVERVIGIKL